MYFYEIPVPTVLDNLLAKRRIPPMVSIIVDNSNSRIEDLANHQSFANFMSKELIPWARQNWNITRDSERTIVTGSTAGGLASAYLAFEHPELFGNVLSQNGAFWRGNEGGTGEYEWLTHQYAATPKRNLRFFI